MSYARLVCQFTKNLMRVHTKKDPNRPGMLDPRSAVEIVSRKSRTLNDGSLILNLEFADGKKVEVTYKDID